MAGQVSFNLEAVDDPVLLDQIPSFDGGEVSNLRENLLQPNQSSVLWNCDIDKLGKLRTRRGTILIGTGPPSGVGGTIIQGLTTYQTKDYNYIVAANNGKLWQWTEGTPGAWTQIARGGVADDEDIVIYRMAQVNNPSGYTAGATSFLVDNAPGVTAPLFAPGEKLYFINNIRTDYYEYTIKLWNTPPNTITLEDPGLVFDIKDDWTIAVARPASVNNAAGYAPGTTTMVIDLYNGEVSDGELFVIKSENVTHTVASHVGSAPTTQITFGVAPDVGLQSDWSAVDTVTPVVFAQGNDQLFFSDGTGPIWGWSGKTSGTPNFYGGLMKIGSHSALDDLAGNFTSSRTTPPSNVRVLVWFMNRLIASGITTEPDAIYFSDFFNGGAWDADYQKIRIGGGESDPITRLVPWTDMLMIIFKKNSIYGINMDPTQNPNPADPTLVVASYGVKKLHTSIGCPAPLSAVQVGGGSSTPGSDIFFVDGDKKVHSVRRVMASETQQELGAAISLPIQNQLDLINLNHIDKCVAMYHNEHYVLGFPDTQGADGGLQNNLVAAYNLLTQTWCGLWNWSPTCFSMRTDLGSYSKLIYGDWRGGTGRVLQWLDDQSLDDETSASYQDFGFSVVTRILTRAITFGDYYAFKTGLYVEFEFDESVADSVTIQVILDRVLHPQLLADPFPSVSAPPLRLPFTLPISPPAPPLTLPSSPGLLRKAFDLQRYGTWRELQFFIVTNADKLSLRSIRVTGFLDTVRLQTIPLSGVPGFAPPATSSGGP